MKILVIGGAGYIGSHVTREFLDQGQTVLVYDNLSSGSKVNLFEDAEFVLGDILDTNLLCEVMKQEIDAVIHLAAFKAAGESMIKPEKYSTNNISGTLNILNAMCEANVNRLVFSSSAATYGEPQYIPLDEKHPTNPMNYYGFTKLEIERFLQWYDQLKGIRFASLRYFNAAGYDVKQRIHGLEKNPANLLPIIMEVAAGKRKSLSVFGDDYETKDGTGVRDYIHVNDLAIGHAAALQYLMDNDESLIVNLGSEEGLSVLDIVEAARRITKQPIDINITARRPGDPAKLVSSAAKARDVLHWKARYSDVDTLVSTSWNVYKSLK